MISTTILLVGFAAADATRANCYLGGDPHVRTFDQTRHWTHHPVFSPGAWYLVHTESGQFQAQAMYSQCGRRTGGGWQGWRKHHNTSAHCLESVAFGGSILEDKSLVVQPPCIWNWGAMNCDSCTADKYPRVTYNGETIECKNQWTTVGEGLEINCRVNRAEVKVQGNQVTMVMGFWGGRGYEPSAQKTCTAGTHANMHLWMENAFGAQCGHCGNFDGNAGNDRIYNQGVLVNNDVPATCRAEVSDCQQLFHLSHTPTQYNSNGYVVSEDDSLCGCAPENECQAEGETRKNVVEECANAYKQVCNVKQQLNPDDHKAFFEECVADVCNGGLVFTDVDVGDESEMACEETQSLNDDAVCKHCVGQ